MHILKTIIRELLRPDDQKNDWYAWATNQCGHAWFAGFPLGLCASAAGLPAAAVFPAIFLLYYLIWETLLQRNHGTRDSITDCFHVSLGAAIVALVWADETYFAVLAYLIHVGALYLGIRRRLMLPKLAIKDERVK